MLFLRQKPRRSINRNRRGLSLIELAIVMGVIGAVMGSIWGIAKNGYERVRREQAFEQITTVVANMRTYYGGQMGLPTGTSWTMPYLVPAIINTRGIIPQDMVRANTASCTANTNNLCADNPWGYTSTDTSGTFQICNWGMDTSTNACDTGTTTGQFFAVVLKELNNGACVQLAAKVSGSAGPAGLMAVAINSTNIPLPVTDANASGNCVATPTNTIAFVYRLRLPGT